MQFDDEEVPIRDLTDDYLNQLTKLYYNIENNTLTQDEVETRLAYYFDILIEKKELVNEKLFTLSSDTNLKRAINNFISVYKYIEVQKLLEHYEKVRKNS